jgi:ATP-dependent Clp protease ATP-binding subunit ClpC
MDLSEFNLTPSAKKAIEDSQIIAESFGQLKVIDLHLLLSILELNHNNIDYILISNDLLKDGFKKSIEYALAHYKEHRRKKKIFAPEIKEILDFAAEKAKKFKDEYIGIDHIFLSILLTRVEVTDFLASLDVDIEKLNKDLEDVIKSGIPKDSIPVGAGQQTQTAPGKDVGSQISDWCENLNEKIAAKGEFEIFGRDSEIERIFEVLLKKNKSNVILVGEAGVGKTAIVEGVAEKIIKRECPDLLLHKKVLSLDLTSVLAGTIYRGQMEEKLKSILEHLASENHYILFIDEIHNIVGAGGSSEGSLDFANIMKPALSRGNISCIGATTKDEYECFFKKDSALNRRFEKIDVREPTKQETLDLIKVAKTSYENFHQVEYKEDVLEKIVDLCEIYLENKKFPDKAFDILDESGAKTKKINIVRPQKAKNMEEKLIDQEFQESAEYDKFHEKYSKIIEKWGENLKDKVFSVDMELIYDIFAHKLNTSKENIKEGKNVPSSGRIGF